VIAEKETDLKGKRLFRPRWITIELLTNVNGMGVILHGLCWGPSASEGPQKTRFDNVFQVKHVNRYLRN
jgi:hypothetical protein